MLHRVVDAPPRAFGFFHLTLENRAGVVSEVCGSASVATLHFLRQSPPPEGIVLQFGSSIRACSETCDSWMIDTLVEDGA